MFAAGLRLVFAPPFWSQCTKAHRLCGEWGLGDDEFDGMMDSWRGAAWTRAEALALFRRQFDRPEDAALCEDWAVGVLDAPGAAAAPDE